jgi:hypothetical protein
MRHIVIVDTRALSLWQRLIGAWLLVFRGGFKFDPARLERGE